MYSHQLHDHGRSVKRVAKDEDRRRRQYGWGLTRESAALRRKYIGQLTKAIATDRLRPQRDKAVWGALRVWTTATRSDQKEGRADVLKKGLWGCNDQDIARQLFHVGASAAASSVAGTDKERRKTARSVCEWIGENFNFRRETAVKFGMWACDMLLNLPIFFLDEDNVLRLNLSEADGLIQGVLTNHAAHNPLLTPLATEPPDWAQVDMGGLPSDSPFKVLLVRGNRPRTLAAIRRAISRGQMRPVLAALNCAQRVPFTINTAILDLQLSMSPPHVPTDAEMAETEALYLAHTTLEGGPLVLYRGGLDTKTFGKKLNGFRRHLRLKRGEALAAHQGWQTDLMTARYLASLKRFFVPLNLDTRGRIYGIPTINYQREDRVRALFMFAEPRELGARGLIRLKSHIAGLADGNTFSTTSKPSRLNLVQRVAWVDEHIEHIRAAAKLALNHKGSATIPTRYSDDTFQFLAAAIELSRALDEADPTTYKSRLPIKFDGNCSGLQHLTAMTRSEKGALVNLTPVEDPDGFYSFIGRKVHPICSELMRGPDDREVVKQPVMTYFYGSRAGGWIKQGGRYRPLGMTAQVSEVLVGRGVFRGSKKLARTIHETIESEFPECKAVRKFLEKLVRLCKKHGNKALSWPTALGWLVINDYHKPILKDLNGIVWRQSKTGKLIKARWRVTQVIDERDEIWVSKAANSVMANFNHSNDAAHLQLVSLAAAKEGIHLAPIHDCFASHACDADRLLEIIIEQFKRLHEESDVLKMVLDSARRALPRNVKLPPLPKRGSLIISPNFHAFK
jgi:DNA-directed RNA polymerase, mitochondrial